MKPFSKIFLKASHCEGEARSNPVKQRAPSYWLDSISRDCFVASLLAMTSVCTLAFAAPRLIDRTVVTVNSEAILESDVDKFQKKLQSKSFQELFGGIAPDVTKNRDSVLQLLVEEKLINQQVKKLELQATDQEVDGQIRSILKRNDISMAQLTERLKQLGTTMAEYKDGIRRQIERKNLLDREIRPTLEVTEEQLRHFYARNAGTEGSESQFKIAHILVSPKSKSSAEWDTAHARAKKIHGEVSSKPEEFAKYVKEYSDDSETVESEGVLGFFNPSSLAKEFRTAVVKTPPGRVTAPIKMADGYHILKVLETATTDFGSVSKEKKEAMRQQMVSEELEKKMALWIERKKREANIQRAGSGNENK
jgi:peptidyl-prolyl cis-trans isomerase SurA